MSPHWRFYLDRIGEWVEIALAAVFGGAFFLLLIFTMGVVPLVGLYCWITGTPFPAL